MLCSLRIRNLAVIEDLSWELDPRFCVLTGETGAGKSILIDAFNLLLGERAEKTLIRDGADSCSVEALVKAPSSAIPFLKEQAIDFENENELILKRTFNRQGQNRQWINDSPVTLQILKKLGDLLVDLHGPHDHQSLFSSEAQLAALDSFAKLATPLEEYQTLYSRQKQDLELLDELQTTDTGNLQQQLDFLSFQIREIEDAHLNPEEEATLDHEYHLASHSQRIQEIASSIYQTLSESENDVFSQLAGIERLLQEWENLDPGAAKLREFNSQALSNLKEIQGEIDSISGQIDRDPQHLHQIETRLNLIQSLKRKYGPNIPSILEKLESLQSKYDSLSGREEKISELHANIEKRQKELDKKAEALTSLRKKHAPKLSEAITDQLQELGFKKASLSISVTPREKAASSGMDLIEFFFSPNPGESARPLKSIASSGEMARVMLAIKTVLAQQDEIPILIFDEIDANVGGETAVVVGKKMRMLADSHQVLCITHLPQVAASGHAHYQVQKDIVKNRTITSLTLLDKTQRIDELSRMLGGKSDSSKAMAKSLLG